MRKHAIVRSIAAGAAACMIVSALVVPAGASPLSNDVVVGQGTHVADLMQFRGRLQQDARRGAPEARLELARFDSLSYSQRTHLSLYLSGELDPFASFVRRAGASSSSAPDTQVFRVGDFQVIAESATSMSLDSSGGGAAGPSFLRMAAITYNVHSSYDYTYSFAGIKLVKTRVWADYKTQSGVVKSVTDWACQVVQNYDIQAEISDTKQSSVLSGGAVTFKCYVVVKRGVPTPWGQITTSTKSGYQYMKVNGNGIVSNGWS